MSFYNQLKLLLYRNKLAVYRTPIAVGYLVILAVFTALTQLSIFYHVDSTSFGLDTEEDRVIVSNLIGLSYLIVAD